MPVSDEPHSLVEQAAGMAMAYIEMYLEEQGAKLHTAFVTIRAENVPEGENDSVTASRGDDLPDDLRERALDILAFLIAQATQVADEIGLTVKVFPLTKPS